MEEADAKFDEALDVILKAWTAEERFSHRGRYWQFDNIVVEPPTAQKPHPPIWMGAGGERSVRRVAQQGYNLLLGQYASPADVGQSIAVYKQAIEATGRRFDPMQVGVTRAFFVTDSRAEREGAMERRLQNRMRQLKLATRPDGTVHGGPDRATGDPRAVNEVSAIYGTPDEIAKRLETLRESGVGMCCSTAAALAAAHEAARACAASHARLCRHSPGSRGSWRWRASNSPDRVEGAHDAHS
jgi:alkanesulfonate monooxygenase SsuD/methylene tetrahydromethanopterin reductase-like flavin-dependent oxidoreductase (luciferase family)